MQPNGRARHQSVEPGWQAAGIDRVEAVDILGRIDRGDDFLASICGGKRELDEDAIDRGIGVEPLDLGQQIGFAGGGGEVVREARHPGFGGRLPLERT